jgi:hypothetical protein
MSDLSKPFSPANPGPGAGRADAYGHVADWHGLTPVEGDQLCWGCTEGYLDSFVVPVEDQPIQVMSRRR